MTLVDKKVTTLGLRGHTMYFTNKQLHEAKEKNPRYNFCPAQPLAPLPKGQHAYTMVERSAWANEMQKTFLAIIEA